MKAFIVSKSTDSIYVCFDVNSEDELVENMKMCFGKMSRYDKEANEIRTEYDVYKVVLG